MIFSSEPSNKVIDRATYALVEFLKTKEQRNGSIKIPLDLMFFNHKGMTEVTICCSGGQLTLARLGFQNQASQQPLQPAQRDIPQITSTFGTKSEVGYQKDISN